MVYWDYNYIKNPNDNKKEELMKQYLNSKSFALIYRLAAFIFIAVGILDTAGVFSGNVNWHIFLTYTVQSNVLVLLFFAVLIVKTMRLGNRVGKPYPFAFYPIVSFVFSIDILITMLIFWTILAPMTWAGGYLLSFSNFAVHLISPLLMIFDRIMFYQPGRIRKYALLIITIFPYVHVAQSFIIGLNRLVYFAPMRIESYYIYPFLDYDTHGNMVFVYILGLSLVFLGIGYAWRYVELRIIAKKDSISTDRK